MVAAPAWGLDIRAVAFGFRATGWAMLLGLALILLLAVLIGAADTLFEWVEATALALMIGSSTLLAVCVVAWPLGVVSWLLLSRLPWDLTRDQNKTRTAALGAGFGASLALPLWHSRLDVSPEQVPLAVYLPALGICLGASALAERRVFGAPRARTSLL